MSAPETPLDAAMAAYGGGGYGHRMRMARAVDAALKAAGVPAMREALETLQETLCEGRCGDGMPVSLCIRDPDCQGCIAREARGEFWS